MYKYFFSFTNKGKRLSSTFNSMNTNQYILIIFIFIQSFQLQPLVCFTFSLMQINSASIQQTLQLIPIANLNYYNCQSQHTYINITMNINTPSPLNHNCTIKLEQPICYQHHQYFTHLCNNHQCSNTTRICKQCVINHQSHSKSVRSEEGAAKDIKKNLALCLQKIDQLDARHLQVTNLMKQSKQSLSDDQQKMIKQLMKQLDVDKQSLLQKLKKIKQLNVYLDQLYRLGKYFKELKKLNLVQLRIQVSSKIGLENFKQKNQLFAQFIKKDVFQSFKYYKSQYDELILDFTNQYENNSTFKLNQIVKMKTSKKEMIKRAKQKQIKQLKENPSKNKDQKYQERENKFKENKDVKTKKKQIQKPKTTSNISEGFFTSIMNFFGGKP